MSLLRELYEEASIGSTCGTGIAVHAEPLLAKPMRRQKIKNMYKLHKPKRKKRKVSESLNDGDFDSQDVFSKMDAAQTKSKHQENTVTFGLEDERGNVVRVLVDAGQAKQFEQTLAKMLGDQFDDTIENYNGTPAKEIAEILFQLKDRFNIVDVKWGDIPVDEEEEPSLDKDKQQSTDDEMSIEDPKDQSPDEMPNKDSEDMDNIDIETDDQPEMSASSSESESSLLQKVIDMMKADAEARKAHAEAREAEAKATVSKYASDAALAKVKQEEEILDMEAYYKDKQQQDKEAKNLAKLAKYKHDVARDSGDNLKFGNDSEENEEDARKVTLQQLSDMIVKRLKGKR